jgi:hypothetical protein
VSTAQTYNVAPPFAAAGETNGIDPLAIAVPLLQTASKSSAQEYATRAIGASPAVVVITGTGDTFVQYVAEFTHDPSAELVISIVGPSVATRLGGDSTVVEFPALS